MIEKLLGLVPLPVKLVAVAVAAALVFGGGVKTGLWWNAGKLKECNDTVDEVRRISDALEIKNEEQRLLSERVTADISNIWAAALDNARSNPRVVRVRQDCGGQGGVPGLSATAPGTTGLQVGRGEGGLSITVGQCEALANDSLLDDKWIRLVKEWTAKQSATRP